jgi:hypothetical protein
MSPIRRPPDSVLTAYDEEYLVTYLRLLDADVVVNDIASCFGGKP